MIDSLPTNWTEAALGELGEWGSGGTPPRKNESYYKNGTIPWLVIGDLNDGEVLKAKIHITEDGLHNSSAKLIEPGTLLVAMYGSIGKLGITSIKCATNQAIAFCRPDSNIVDLKFLFHALANANKELIAQGQGGAQQNISQTILKAQQISLPPINEQRRIADKLDTTLAAVKACNQKLNNAAETIQRFRQSVLAAAVSGELTREWREERGIEGEWEFKAAKDVCSKVQSGGTPKEGFTEEGIPFLKVYNIVDQKVSFEYKPQFIDPEIHLTSMKKSRCMPGDVLMNIVGPPLGKVAITPEGYDEWNINQAITLFRPSSEITTEWLYILLCEGKNIREVELSTKGSAGQKNISLTQCREFNFPCPSVEEQQMACELVGSLFEIASTAEERINSAKEHAEKLAPAILAKAFRGELVPQDPNDEPASVLLKRIKAQREAEAAAKKPAKRGRKKEADAAQLVIPAGIADNHLTKVLQECGALSQRALLAASELEPAVFQLQLLRELEGGLIKKTSIDEFDLSAN